MNLMFEVRTLDAHVAGWAIRLVTAGLPRLDGSLVERLSASEALALACGDAAPELALAA